MSDILRMLYDNEGRLKQTETKEVPLSGAGTAFPSSPPTGMRFWRTDLNFLCFYDGTRWLTINEYVILRGYLDQAGSASFADIFDYRQDYAPYFSRVTFTSRVSTTNDGSNYWTIAFKSYNLAFGASTTIYSIDTSADAVNTYIQRDAAATTPNPANIDHLVLDLSITAGAPGTLRIIPYVCYRLIVT